MDRKPYTSDLTDDEWAIQEPMIPLAKTGGRPRTAAMREVLNGIFYVLKSGCHGICSRMISLQKAQRIITTTPGAKMAHGSG
jgi:transposase